MPPQRRGALEGAIPGIAIVDVDHKLVDGAIEELQARYDKVLGGFGFPSREFSGPKFPTPTNLQVLQHEANRTKSKELDAIVFHTLDKMALGGIYDHLGGGFHRYSPERTWTVPTSRRCSTTMPNSWRPTPTLTKRRRSLSIDVCFVRLWTT